MMHHMTPPEEESGKGRASREDDGSGEWII